MNDKEIQDKYFALFQSHMAALERWDKRPVGEFCHALHALWDRQDIPNDAKSLIQVAICVIQGSAKPDQLIDLTLGKRPTA